jgi:dTMP kinase
MLILWEGPEGAGKTTLVSRFMRDLELAGISALSVREPGGTEAGQAIRDIFLSTTSKLTPLAEFFLLQASRAQLLHEKVIPELERGGVVVMDRFSLSTMAYQIAGRGLPLSGCLSALELATGGLTPDITILLMASVAVGRGRQAAMKKKADRIEAEEAAFHQRVNDGYRRFARILPSWNVRVIETDSATMDEVYAQAIAQIMTVWQPACTL